MFPTDTDNTTTTSVPSGSEQTDVVKEATPETENKKRWQEFRRRIELCKNYRKKLIRNWAINVDFRRGKPFSSQVDDDTIPVNLDWSFTKTKQAALFSQVPKVRVVHSPESLQAGPWIAAYERKLNDNLVTGGIEACMDEVLPDCINAAGIGVALVAYEALTEMKQVPAIDLSIFPPQIQQEALRSGKLFGNDIPMEEVPQKIDSRYTIRRISPADFLWPIDFTGSDFDNAPWLGYSGRIPWAEAVTRFNLAEEDKEKFMSEDRTVDDRLSRDYDREHMADDGKVGFDEIFYNEFQYDSQAKSFSTIRHLVFLHGKTEPIIDEQWKGQIIDEQEPGKVIGSKKKPIRVLTLAYITDEDIPPSDSAIGRAQVLELSRGRTHISKQRARNAPVMWHDVNRLDPAIQNALMRGVWQHSIPVQGDGSRILGSVQMPAMQQENFTFDSIAKADLQELWTIGSNQLGVGGDVETKGESGVIQNNFMTKVARERARVASFFVGIAEVVGSLMCLYEDPQVFGEGFDPKISQGLNYSILADSTILVDSEQRLERLNNFVNVYAKSGFLNLEPILREIATLIGLDPNVTIKAPEPAQPELPNISLRLTGGDDMMNPLLLAFMLKTGQAPEPELIDQAKALIEKTVKFMAPAPTEPGPVPEPPPVGVGEDNPDLATLPAINKRSADQAIGNEG